jgi:hypothetical protein
MKITGYLLVLFALSGLFRPALAIDLQPGDIVAPPPNITAATISYINSQNNDLFRNGVNTGADPKLESNAVFLRLTHTYTIAHYQLSLIYKPELAPSLPMDRWRLFG